MPLPIREVVGARLEAQPAAGAETANASEGAATVVEVTITSNNSSIINKRQTQGSSSAHSIVINKRLYGSSNIGDIRSNIGTIPGPAGLDHLIDSIIEVKRPTSTSNNSIGEETSHIGTSRVRAIAAARRGTSTQSTKQL